MNDMVTTPKMKPIKKDQSNLKLMEKQPRVYKIIEKLMIADHINYAYVNNKPVHIEYQNSNEKVNAQYLFYQRSNFKNRISQ